MTESTNYGFAPAKEITEERYQDMLEVLPPCKWTSPARGCSVFHVSERLSKNIVSWFVQVGSRFFELQDVDTLTGAQVLALVSHAINSPEAV